MKFLSTSILFFSLSLLFIGCSSDNNNNNNPVYNGVSTLYVNGNIFNLGENNAERIYNSLIYSDGHRAVISVIENTPAGVDPEVIELDFNYAGTDINGTYPVYGFDYFGDLPPNYVKGDYNTISTFYGHPEASGNIKITSLANQTYKIEFINAVFPSSDHPEVTKVINGYCQKRFY